VTLAKLQINGETICEVTAEAPDWLPVRPRLPRAWLRALFAAAFRSYYQAQRARATAEVVKT
jgi:hypothetical protein